MAIHVVIPARYGSSRFPGKPLTDIGGRPMVRWVMERAAAARGVASVAVATDDDRIARAVEAFGGRVVLTPSELPAARTGWPPPPRRWACPKATWWSTSRATSPCCLRP